MTERDLQRGGGYTYQWECAILLALNYFFDPVRYNPTLFDLVESFLGQVDVILLEGEDRESEVDLEDITLVNGDRRILVQVKTKEAEGKLWTLADRLLLKALYKFYDSHFLSKEPSNTRFVFLTNRSFNTDLVSVKTVIAEDALDGCAEAEALRKHLERYARNKKKESSLFSVGLEFRSYLEGETLPKEFKKKFEDHQIPLSENVTVKTEEEGRRWRINDEDQGKAYNVYTSQVRVTGERRKEDVALDIYNESIDESRFREMLARTALVEYLAVDEVKANVQAKLQALGRHDWEQAHAILFEHFARQSSRKGGGTITRTSVMEVLGRSAKTGAEDEWDRELAYVPKAKARVFLCHAKEDKPRVRELYHQLKSAGYHPWLDEEDLLVGQDWWTEIEKIISDPYNLVVVCLSNNSTTKRGVVQREISRALDVLNDMPEDTIYLMPARLEPCDVPRRLNHLHWINLFEPDGFEKLTRSLEFEIRKRQPPFEPELILIPAGEFLMGSTQQQVEQFVAQGAEGGWVQPEVPQHSVGLPAYYLAKTPVTNAQYLAFVESTGHVKPDHWKGGQPPKNKEDHPVVNVNWWNAVSYCQWLANTTGRPYRLPSEPEWEMAARGADGRIYPWGDEWDAERCNTRERGPGDTTSVGQYSPGGDSPYGCVDMAGNVWEWTLSIRESYPYDPEDGREHPMKSSSRVMRGGSFYNDMWSVRCASRDTDLPGARAWNYGFRVCVAAQQE